MSIEPFQPSLAERIDLEANQLETLQSLEGVIARGATKIEIWGISGSGKSTLEEKLKDDPRFAIVSPYSKRGTGQIELSFKTGVQDAADPSSTDTVHIVHSGFDAKRTYELGKKELERYRFRGPQFRQDEEPFLAKALEQLGLGSVTYFCALVKVPRHCDIAERIATLFYDDFHRLEGRKSGAASTLLVQYANSAPIDLSFTSEKSRLLDEVLQQIKIIESNPWSMLERWSGLNEQLVYGIAESILDYKNLSSVNRETIDWYRGIPKEKLKKVKEPSFLLRSAEPVDPEQTRAICQDLKPVLDILNHRSFNIQEYRDFPVLDGEAGRKTGLYRFVGKAEDVFWGNFAMVKEERDLIPIVGDSQTSRVALSELYIRNEQCIPVNTLVFGGGDHDLHPSHVGMCLALELSMQKHGIGYEVNRGFTSKYDCAWDFKDGVLVAGSLEPQEGEDF